MNATAGSLDPDHPALRNLPQAGFGRERVAQVLALYDEPHRCYHDRLHLREMLDAAQALHCELSAAQALALLFHDAVYVPGAARGANETLSAQLLRVYARGVDPAVVELAGRIVIDTADHEARSDEARLVLDLDLMRLAAGEADFDRYSRQVFAEQRPLLALDDDDAAGWFFRRRRLPFFERLLQRAEVFCLPLFRARYEQVTRANLRREIEAVGAAPAAGAE
jgi:predicted metal-dependent HD superfamily phosphohydrolase